MFKPLYVILTATVMAVSIYLGLFLILGSSHVVSQAPCNMRIASAGCGNGWYVFSIELQLAGLTMIASSTAAFAYALLRLRRTGLFAAAGSSIFIVGVVATIFVASMTTLFSGAIGGISIGLPVGYPFGIYGMVVGGILRYTGSGRRRSILWNARRLGRIARESVSYPFHRQSLRTEEENAYLGGLHRGRIAAFDYSERQAAFVARIMSCLSRAFYAVGASSHTQELVFWNLYVTRNIERNQIIGKPTEFIEGLQSIYGEAGMVVFASMMRRQIKREFGPIPSLDDERIRGKSLIELLQLLASESKSNP